MKYNKDYYYKCIDFLMFILFVWLSLILYKLHFPNIRINKNNDPRKVSSEPDFGAMFVDLETGQQDDEFDLIQAQKDISDAKLRSKNKAKKIELSTTKIKKIEEMSDEVKNAKSKLSDELFEEFAYLAKREGLKAWCRHNGYSWSPSPEEEASRALLKMCKHTKDTCNDSIFSKMKDGKGDSKIIWKEGQNAALTSTLERTIEEEIDDPGGTCYLHPSIYNDLCDSMSNEDSKHMELEGGGFFTFEEGMGYPMPDGSTLEGGEKPPSCHPTRKYCVCEKGISYNESKRDCKMDELQGVLEMGQGVTFTRKAISGLNDITAACSGGQTDFLGCDEHKKTAYKGSTGNPAVNCTEALLTKNPITTTAVAVVDASVKAVDNAVHNDENLMGFLYDTQII